MLPAPMVRVSRRRPWGRQDGSWCGLAALFSVDAFAAPGLPLTLALLLVRSAHSRMDVPARSACVMVVVTPGERRAAASFTTVPRSLAAALSPTLSGLLFAAGWISAALVACGALKIAYDLALWRACRGDVLEEHAR